MTKVYSLRTSMLCMAVLMGAEAVSARAAGNSAPVMAGQPAEFKVLPSAAISSIERTRFHILNSAQGAIKKAQLMDSGLIVSASLLPTIWFSPINSMGGEKNDPPAPVPEPSTMLSLVAAVIIGGGVLFLRRLRGDRK